MDNEEKEKYKRELKKIFNNSYTIVFSVLAFVIFLFSLLSFLNAGKNIEVLSQLFYVFSARNLLFLGIMLTGSAILAHFKKFNLMFLPILFWLLITTALVRTQNIPNLIDVSTGNYTLGPDLDPFLFLRNAIELLEGTAGNIDTFRYAPLLETPSYVGYNLMPWAILYVYRFLSVFSDISITYAAIIAPVIFFIISVIGFFLFAKTISSFKFSNEKSWIIATVSSIFYAFSPAMLHRTVAGIPELESLGMVWFWFAFLFISLAWRETKKKKQILFAVFAGIFTGAMSWTWGGYRYIYMAIFLSSFLIFIFEKEKSKNRLIFSSWFLVAILIEILKTRGLISAVSSLSDTGISLFLLTILWINYLLFETKLKGKIKLNKIKIPDSIKSLIIVILAGLILGFILFPEKMIGIFSSLIEYLLYPFGRGRVGLTVSENQAPYFTDVISNFGNMFWLFFFGTILIFYEAVKHFGKKEKLFLCSGFIIFITTFIFSRISSASKILNGDTIISHALYFGGAISFGLIFLGIYLLAYKKNNEKVLGDFKEIDFSYLLFLSLSIIIIISMRGAVRLFFLVAPILVLIGAVLPVKIYEWRKSNDSLIKMISIILVFATILIMIGLFASYSSSTSYAAASTIPSSYNNQWQYAMSWVRENTPINSIFVHWWDYGYWVQSLGERPTVTDGGHDVGYWDHLTARYLLTEKNPDAALSLMKSYNVSYLLIDSTDLGKYSAFSKIGGDENYDTFSAIPTGVLDKTQTQETQNSTVTVYSLNGFVDGDIQFEENGTEIFIPGPTYNEIGDVSVKAYVIGAILKIDSENKFYQPIVAFYYNGKQINLPVRYVYYEGKIIDFGSGIESIIRLVPRISSSSTGMILEKAGGMIYLSPKVSKSLFSRLYLLNDVFEEYPSVELTHSEDSELVKQLNLNGYKEGEFVFYDSSLYGPIKIWKVNYPSNIIAHEEFLRKDGGYAEFDNLTFAD